jgi:superfamily II DNA or RNA helicase
MKVVRRDPTKGYLDAWLWLPKSAINVDGTKRSLSFVTKDSYTGHETVYYLYQEAPHHLLVPRAFWRLGQQPFDLVDCRPRKFAQVKFRSRIKLDHRIAEQNGKKKLLPTGDDVQRKSIAALSRATGGTLQLACVAGDTVLNLNRGKNGFKMDIATAHKRWVGADRYAWDHGTDTYIRSDVGEHVGLNRVLAIIKKGVQRTWLMTLVDGKSLRLTAYHKVLTPTGYARLDSLRVDDEVVVEGKRRGSTRKKKVAYQRIGGFKHHPYSRYQSRSWCIEKHRAVMEAHLSGVALDEFKARCSSGKVDGLTFIDPKRFHVHHKNGDIHNNSIYNLEVLRAEEHLSKHRPGASAFGYGELHRVRIASISEPREEVVYDVACEAPHNNYAANGIIVHNCGKGKSVIALEDICLHGVPSLILVDNTNLMEQWEKLAGDLVTVPGGIGVIASGRRDWKKGLVLATYQTVASWAATMPEEVRRWFGRIYWDEGHHLSAPVFSKSAPLFYGTRILLTATPERDDGLHVIADMHCGPVLHKDLTEMMSARTIFYWTGLELDLTDPQCTVLDVNGELHTSKVFSYFGRWRRRLDMLIQHAQEAVACKRKVLVLSNSVDEVVNLMTLWTRGAGAPLYSDIPIPTNTEVGSQVTPKELSPTDLKKKQKYLDQLTTTLTKDGAQQNPAKKLGEARRSELQLQVHLLQQELEQHAVYKLIAAELDRRQRAFIKALIAEQSTAGFMTYTVPAKTRQQFLDTRDVVFAITKYGKEGLDCPALDTVLVSTPFSKKGGLQQLRGRPTRPMPGKKPPLIVLYRDEIGVCHGMCKKLEKHMNSWPHDEGGPVLFEYINNPRTARWQKAADLKEAFGQL